MLSKWFLKLTDDLVGVRREQPVLGESLILKVLTSEEYLALSQEEWDKAFQSLCDFSKKSIETCTFCAQRERETIRTILSSTT